MNSNEETLPTFVPITSKNSASASQLTKTREEAIGGNVDEHSRVQSQNFLTFKDPKNRFQGTNSARLCSLSGRYDNPIPTQFLVP